MADDRGWLRSLDCQVELLALLETLVNVMFCAKDVDGVYREVNSAFVRRTGRRSKRDVLGRTAHEIFSPERAEHYVQQDRSVIGSREPLRDELELIRRPDGDLGWYLTTKLPVMSRSDPTIALGLVSVSRDLVTSSQAGGDVESLQPMVRHVRERLGEPITVTELAAVAECSPSQLDRRVRRVFGLSAKQYVLRVKVERAMRLLSESDAPIADIAVEAGFYDQPEFSRRFARLTGWTPAQFRSADIGRVRYEFPS